MVQPSHIIQFNYTSQEQTNKNLPTITEEFLMNTPGWAFVVDDEKQHPNNQRSVQFIGKCLVSLNRSSELAMTKGCQWVSVQPL